MIKPTTLVIAEDIEIYMNGLLFTLNQVPRLSVIAKATNGDELVKQVIKHQPDVVLTDIMMPVMTGIEACNIITAKYPLVTVIATTVYEEESLIMAMIEAGATSFVMKNASIENLVEAIHAARKAQPYYCPATNRYISRHFNRAREKAALPKFTSRELEIMQLICNDLSHHQIAKKLCVSKTTVDICSHRILQKTGQRSAVGILNYALKHGLIKTSSDHP